MILSITGGRKVPKRRERSRGWARTQVKQNCCAASYIPICAISKETLERKPEVERLMGGGKAPGQ